MVIDKTKPNVSLLIETAKQLPMAELVRLIQALLELFQEKFFKPQVAPDEITAKLNQLSPRRKWGEIAGTAPYPLVGEDAQVWVSRTRLEDDQERQLQWHPEP
jgi:hypothetical protein